MGDGKGRRKLLGCCCRLVGAGAYCSAPEGAQQEDWPEGTAQERRWGGVSVSHLKADQEQIPSCPVTSEVGEMWSGSALGIWAGSCFESSSTLESQKEQLSPACLPWDGSSVFCLQLSSTSEVTSSVNLSRNICAQKATTARLTVKPACLSNLWKMLNAEETAVLRSHSLFPQETPTVEES